MIVLPPNVVYPHLIVGESDLPTVFCGITGLRWGERWLFTKRKDFDD
jgi:hypothetical protein